MYAYKNDNSQQKKQKARYNEQRCFALVITTQIRLSLFGSRNPGFYSHFPSCLLTATSLDVNFFHAAIHADNTGR
ncbi:MAG: hypothetical protein OXC48_04850 [Endozoicomonadaceae bacterium]|nr:hypothetical protein [Endozoicomonadaceae bacterium]